MLHGALFMGVRWEMPEPPAPTPHVLEARLLPMPLSSVVEPAIKPPAKVAPKPSPKPRTKSVAAKPDVALLAPQQTPMNMEARRRERSKISPRPQALPL